MRKAFRIGTVVLMAAVLILGYYFYLEKQTEKADVAAATKLAEYDKIVTKDLVNDYPRTPREVVKWYNRIITEYYAAEHNDSEIYNLANQQRKLLDEELLTYNPEDEFLLNVKTNIVDFAARDEHIVQSKVCSSNDVRYDTVLGYECAYATSYYFSREGNDYIRTYQEYCLRKDSDGHWKILTWRLTDGDPDDYQ